MRDAVRRHQDGLLALVVLACGVVPALTASDDVAWACACAVALAAAVAARRRVPILALSTAQALGVVVTALHLTAADTAGFVVADVVLTYTAGSDRSRRTAAAGLTISLAAFWAEDAMIGHRPLEYAASAALMAAPWGVGWFVQRERTLRATLREALETERIALAQTAVAEERQRIARDIEQIVAHGLAAIAVQGNAAEGALLSDPARARRPIQEINDTARRCMDEMRVLLTVLRGIAPITVGRPDFDTSAVSDRRLLLSRWWSWRDHALAVVVLVAGLAAALGSSSDRVPAAVVATLAALPVLARRSHTVLAATAELVLGIAAFTLWPQLPLGPVFALASLVILYPGGARLDHTSVAVLAIGLAEFWTGDALRHHGPSDYLASAVTVGGVWLIGAVVGRAQQLRAQVTDATEAERRALVIAAADEERRRLAREMHDVVAHGLSAIAVQSDAADAALSVDPGRTLTAVRTVSSLAAQCGAEMRQLLGTLGADEAEEAAAAVAADVHAVLAAQQTLGLAVRSRVDDDALTGAASGVRQAAVRIVQEALTNVRRHSSSDRVDVEIERVGDAVRLVVTDPGPARSCATRPAGHGTAGIRERAAVFDGECRIGPHGSGWRVDVLLPLRTAPLLLGEPA